MMRRLFKPLAMAFWIAAAAVLALPAAAQDRAAFELDESQTPAPSGQSVDRETPRSTLEGFVDSARRGDFETAASYLNLDDLPRDLWNDLGPERARQLHEIIRRQIWLDWNDVPDRDDGLDAFASSDDPTAGEERRSILLGAVDLEGRPVEVRINRYQPENSDAVWLVSRRTVGYLPRLYDQHGPGAIEGWLPESLKEEAFWRIPIWQVIALPLFLALSGFMGLLVYRAMRFAERRITPRNEDGNAAERWLPAIVRRSAMPLALLVSATLVAILNASLLSFSGPASAVVTILTTVVLVVALSLVLLRIIGTILDIATSNLVSSIDDEENSQSRNLYTNISVVRRIVIVLALLVGAAVVVSQLNLSQSLGVSLLASAGVLSLILGFAAQTVLGNVLASIQIAIAKPIRIGDAIEFEGEWGYVEEINFTYVLVQTWDGRRFIVPVRYFVSEPFENWSIRDAALIQPVEIKLDPTADLEVLRSRFTSILEGDEEWDERQEPKVLVVANDGWTITVRFYASAANPTAAWNLQCRLREKLYAFLRDHREGNWLPRERQEFVGRGLSGGRTELQDTG